MADRAALRLDVPSPYGEAKGSFEDVRTTCLIVARSRIDGFGGFAYHPADFRERALEARRLVRDHNHAFCQIATECFDIRGPVYEFGSYQVDGQEAIADLRDCFPDRTYVGCDLRPGPGVDRVLDVTRIALPDSAVGAVLAFETFEHVYEIDRAFREVFRVLRPGGMFLITCPFHFRIHAFPDDYWRMTPSCLRRMLSGYGARIVGFQGYSSCPHTVMGLAVKAPTPRDFAMRAAAFTSAYQAWANERRQAEPWARRAWNRLRTVYRSKGERRRITDYYRAQFVVDLAYASLARVG
jgi:SAM-dependent methyltransferase